MSDQVLRCSSCISWLVVGRYMTGCKYGRAVISNPVVTFGFGDGSPRRAVGNQRRRAIPPARWRAGSKEEWGGERVTRLELATSSLARRCSTTELHPHFSGWNNGRHTLRCKAFVCDRERWRGTPDVQSLDIPLDSKPLLGSAQKSASPPIYRMNHVAACSQAGLKIAQRFSAGSMAGLQFRSPVRDERSVLSSLTGLDLGPREETQR